MSRSCRFSWSIITLCGLTSRCIKPAHGSNERATGEGERSASWCALELRRSAAFARSRCGSLRGESPLKLPVPDCCLLLSPTYQQRADAARGWHTHTRALGVAEVEGFEELQHVVPHVLRAHAGQQKARCRQQRRGRDMLGMARAAAGQTTLPLPTNHNHLTRLTLHATAPLVPRTLSLNVG